MWIEVVKKLKLDLEIIYEAEEAGCGLYWTNNPALEGKYILDCLYDDDTICEIVEKYEALDCTFKMTEEELKDFLKDILNSKEDDLGALIIKLKQDQPGAFSINKWETVELSELD